MKLGTLIALLGIVSASILFGAVAVVIYVEFPEQQDALLRQKGWAMAENLRRQIEPMVLVDDKLRVAEAITSARLSDKDIEYIFVLDSNKRPFASTFSRGVPESLLNLFGGDKKEKKISTFIVDGRSKLDISIPLMEGGSGSVHLGINREPILAFMRSSLLRLAVVFVVLILAGTVMAVLTGRAVAGPLGRLTSTLNQARSRWPNLEHVTTGPTREVQEFVAIFKQMISELEEAERNRQNYERKLLVAERLASTGQLAAEIAHEISNPLDGMLAISRHLEDIADDPEKVRKYTKLTAQGLERIGKIGRQLLNLARRDITDYKEICDVREVIENTTGLLNGSLENRGISIKVSCGRKKYFAIGNAVAIGQVLMNLLLNAADAIHGQGGEVKIEVGSEDGNILIAVTDNGPGISEEVSKEIFDVFFTTKAETGGTGLGLAVSRNLVEKCGGELLLAERKTKTGGAKFVIKLKGQIVQEEH